MERAERAERVERVDIGVFLRVFSKGRLSPVCDVDISRKSVGGACSI